MDIGGLNSSWASFLKRPRPDYSERGSSSTAKVAVDKALGRRVAEGSAQSCGGPMTLFEIFGLEGRARPFLAPIGVDESGRTIWLDLHRHTSRHVLVEGGAPSARAEILRATAIGLALTTRPALLQTLAIDASGRELSVLETLPHAVTDVANDAAAAQVTLGWLAAELDTRVQEGRRWPEMLLVVENVSSLAGAESGMGRHALSTILRTGGSWGMHILAAAPVLDAGLKSAGWSRPDVARLAAVEPEGWFEFFSGGRPTRLAGVRVAAFDLDRVARGHRSTASVSPEGAGRRSGFRREDRRRWGA